jgi:hypothetical protein
MSLTVKTLSFYLILLIFILFLTQLTYLNFSFLLTSDLVVLNFLQKRVHSVLLSEFCNRECKKIKGFLEPTLFFEPLSLTGFNEKVNCNGLREKECRIKQLFIEALKQCKKYNKSYCLIMEDDIFLLESVFMRSLYYYTLPWNNDNSYTIDCNKFGVYRYNYKPNGNGLQCRLFSKFLVDGLIECQLEEDGPPDVLLEKCLKGRDEKRFLGSFNLNG